MRQRRMFSSSAGIANAVRRGVKKLCQPAFRARGAARGLLAAALVIGLAGSGTVLAANPPLATGAQSGLPVPRFVSIKSDRVNVRAGPTKDHEVVWVFARAGLPVEITAEFENWRRIRDWEGAEGWVYHSLLSGRRSAFVAKRKNGDDLVPLYDSPESDATIKARLQPGVLGHVKHCNGVRCRFFGEKFDGYVAQDRLWGVYPGEKID
jgi:SH3-like domain-containing protein